MDWFRFDLNSTMKFIKEYEVILLRIRIIIFLKHKKRKNSIAGTRTRVSWVKAKYPNRWTTMEVLTNQGYYTNYTSKSPILFSMISAQCYSIHENRNTT